MDRARLVAGTSGHVLIDYFQLLKTQIENNNLEDHPSRIWNMDEKGWSKQQSLQKPVLVTKGKPQVIFQYSLFIQFKVHEMELEFVYVRKL